MPDGRPARRPDVPGHGAAERHQRRLRDRMLGDLGRDGGRPQQQARPGAAGRLLRLGRRLVGLFRHPRPARGRAPADGARHRRPEVGPCADGRADPARHRLPRGLSPAGGDHRSPARRRRRRPDAGDRRPADLPRPARRSQPRRSIRRAEAPAAVPDTTEAALRDGLEALARQGPNQAFGSTPASWPGWPPPSRPRRAGREIAAGEATLESVGFIRNRRLKHPFSGTGFVIAPDSRRHGVLRRRGRGRLRVPRRRGRADRLRAGRADRGARRARVRGQRRGGEHPGQPGAAARAGPRRRRRPARRPRRRQPGDRRGGRGAPASSAAPTPSS